MARIEPGSVLHTVLLYVVSDPGDWTEQEIVDDLDDLTLAQVQNALTLLVQHGLVHQNSTDRRLWPTRAGKDLFRQAV
jgi:Fe2+ or Zn2+ uptake regulation protein